MNNLNFRLLRADEIDVKACKHREKRSLDSNAYAWVLMQKIAEAIGSNKDDVYIRCLQRYSRSFTHIIVKANAVERMKEEFFYEINDEVLCEVCMKSYFMKMVDDYAC